MNDFAQQLPDGMDCDEVIRLAKNIITARFHRLGSLSSAEETISFLQLHIGILEHEVFSCIFLDQQHRVICFERLFSGTINSANVSAREIIKRALACNAGAVIFAHNHPSGVCEPSTSDLQITKRLKDALSLFDIRMIDHIIVSGCEHTSMANQGLL